MLDVISRKIGGIAGWVIKKTNLYGDNAMLMHFLVGVICWTLLLTVTVSLISFVTGISGTVIYLVAIIGLLVYIFRDKFKR